MISPHNATEGAGEATEAVAVLCVDDSQQVAEAVRITLERAGGFEWAGWLPGADALVPTVERDGPGVVILDIDMPGRSPFDALQELAEKCPECRTIVFSGHVRDDFIDRAFGSGAWGYVSKNDGDEALVRAMRDICRDEVAMSREVRAVYERRVHRAR